MGRNKQLREQIQSLKEVVSEHLDKISAELNKPNPDYGTIRHWEGEIRGRLKEIDRKRDKLPGRRKK
jgi:hypothetical protein